MRVTVWTKLWTGSFGGEFRKAKCVAIFDDYKLPLPTKGMQVQVRDGIGYEVVELVMLNMLDGTVEVHLDTTDQANVYGESLLTFMKVGKTGVWLPAGDKK